MALNIYYEQLFKPFKSSIVYIQMIVVQIHRDGTMDEPDISSVTLAIETAFQSSSKSQGEGHIRLLYEWPYEDNVISCYGWYDGEAGFENKHELPPSGNSKFLEEDSSVALLFGDVFLCMDPQIKGSNSLCDFDISMYSEFFHNVIGGFDECESDDYESDGLSSNDFIDDEDHDEDDDMGEDGEVALNDLLVEEMSDDPEEMSSETLDYSDTDLPEDECDYFD